MLLTPGPYNETYFEHAYLARYLGYTLVEGGDLTVRDNRVYLKLLGGLQPVDVILRRLDDDFCDPLELRGDSFLGVPGLVQAVRAGNVAVANALGSGLVETPALMPFLPALCRQLAGRGPASCPRCRPGGAATRRRCDHVLANLHRHGDQADRSPPADCEPIFGEKLSREAAPGAGREDPRPGRATTSARSSCHCPRRRSWSATGLEPRHLVLRVYLAAAGNVLSAVMPGGLTRVAASADTLVGLDAAGRRQQGYLGAVRGAGEHVQPAAADGAAGRAEPRRRRPAQPRGRQPVTGWAATSSAPRAWCACCAASWSG